MRLLFQVLNGVKFKITDEEVVMWSKEKRGAIELAIQKSLEEADLKNSKFYGKPLEIKDNSHVPIEDRMTNEVYKQYGILPPEMELKKKIAKLRDSITEDSSEEELVKIRKKISLMEMEFNIKTERRLRR